MADARPDGRSSLKGGGGGVELGLVNHQVAFLERGSERVALAIFTEYSPTTATAPGRSRGGGAPGRPSPFPEAVGAYAAPGTT